MIGTQVDYTPPTSSTSEPLNAPIRERPPRSQAWSRRRTNSDSLITRFITSNRKRELRESLSDADDPNEISTNTPLGIRPRYTTLIRSETITSKPSIYSSEIPDELIHKTPITYKRKLNNKYLNSRGEATLKFMEENSLTVLNGRIPSDHPAQFTPVNLTKSHEQIR